MSESIQHRLRQFARAFDQSLATYLIAPSSGDVPQRLSDAMHYSVLAPGKRIRPYLVVRSCELAGGDAIRACPAAAAVECVHAFSLIHDDLPAMDNDDLRRGQPTCHKKFDEATAILAGDALLALAFEIVLRDIDDAQLARDVALELASAAGESGMIGGQMADILGESQPPDAKLARSIHRRKTARLFEAATRIGARLGSCSPAVVDDLACFGDCVGRAFQIADDLLDVGATADMLGKSTGKDVQSAKQSFPRCVGLDGSRAALEEAVRDAEAALKRFGEEADDLRSLARYLADRDY